MWTEVFSDNYSKIAWFCERKNINYDENILSKAVILRNKLAHGENICIDYRSREYDLITKLSYAYIQEKFFYGIKYHCLEADIIY